MEYRDMHIEGENVSKIVKALSSEVRIKILNLLEDEDLNIQALSQRLKLGKTTVLTHINILEEAGFVSTHYVPGTVGNQKMCRKLYDRLIYNFSPNKEYKEAEDYFEISTPVGSYFDFEVYPPCGLASRDNVIKKWDEPLVFYDIDRVKAGLAWCAFGFIEYKIPLDIPFRSHNMSKIEVLAEISAQGDILKNRSLNLPQSINTERVTDGVSDITFWVNGIEAGSFKVREYSRGNRGAGGRYTPTWWRGSNFGELVRITIRQSGIYINDEPQGSLNIKDLNIRDYLRFRIGIKENSENISGFNIYGSSFGNYSNDILVRVYR